jgi:glycosyltransferase involved in cell wall biosynthesis
LRRRAEVWIVASVDSPLAELEQYFGVGLTGAKLVALGTADDAEAEAEIARLRPTVLINNSYRSNLRNSARSGLYMCMFPHPTEESSEAGDNGARGEETRGLPSGHAVRTYTAITANSRFTRRWIRRRWGLHSTVVYSPCDPLGPARPKQRRILHVGRFSDPRRTPHPKRQDVLIETFARMTNLHGEGWRLDLAGSVDPGNEGAAEVDRLRSVAADLPVDFHPMASREKLRALYQEAAIFWHATGFGSAESEAPEEQEHFGVAIVEAMSAGAIPIVRNAGGPREIVRHGYSGYRWTELEELESRTCALVSHPARRERMAKRAIRASRRFSRENFLRRVDRVLGS